MPFPRLGAVGVGLNAGLLNQSNPNIPGTMFPSSNAISLQAGSSYLIPSGNYVVTPGPYTALQVNDPISGKWLTVGASPNYMAFPVQSDGTNWRLANLTGCAVAALITNANATGCTTGIGSATVGTTATASTGGSTWVPIVGGAISTTCVTGVTGTTPGSGFLYNPIAIISPPPAGGLQATAHVTGIPTTGALLAAQVIVDNQGAGYLVKSTGLANATLTIINDPRDTAGVAGVNPAVVGNINVIQLGITGTGQLTGLYPSNQGFAITAVPTLSFSVGGAAATAIMCFTVTSFVTGFTGANFTTGSTPELVSISNIVSGTPSWTNPLHEKGFTFPRPCRIMAGLSTNQLTTTGAVVEDGGYGIQGVPILNPIGLFQVTGITGTVPCVANVGGIADESFLTPV